MPPLKSILSVTATLAALALVGCQRYPNVPRGELNETPLDVDEAMEIRDWEPMSARYTNPRFIAGPTGFWYQPAYDMPAPVYAIQETPMFVLQALALPVTMWLPPLWTPVQYAGETLPPTWHAMPPLPPAREGEPPAPAEVIERGTDEPVTPAAPGRAAPAPYEDEAPGRTVIPGTQPTRGLEGERLPATQRLDTDRLAPPRDVPATTPPPRTGAVPAPAPAPAPAARTTPAARPTMTTTPSRAAQTRTAHAARTTPTTRPTTAPARTPARDVNK
jgi:hypothetical protein